MSNCYICKKELTQKRVIFNNSDEAAFIYLPENESAHIECYIEECIRQCRSSEE